LILALPHAVLKAENSSLPNKISGSIEIYSFWRVREKCISIWKKNLVKAGQAIYIPSNALVSG
jgi:hypothetical protein